MADPFTMTHLLMAATAGAALPAILGGKEKVLELLKMRLMNLVKKKKLLTEDLKLKMVVL
jgi:hypothetical protein